MKIRRLGSHSILHGLHVPSLPSNGPATTCSLRPAHSRPAPDRTHPFAHRKPYTRTSQGWLAPVFCRMRLPSGALCHLVCCLAASAPLRPRRRASECFEYSTTGPKSAVSAVRETVGGEMARRTGMAGKQTLSHSASTTEWRFRRTRHDRDHDA